MTIKHGKLVILMILVAGVLIVPTQAETNLTVYLGRDDFDSEKWVSALDQTTVNATAGLLILSQFNATIDMSQDLTNYTLFEESGNLITNINSTHVRAKCDLKYTRYLYYDFGADFFGSEFNISFAVYINGIGPAGVNDHYYFQLSNETVASRSQIYSAGDDTFTYNILNDNSGDDYKWRVGVQDQGVTMFSTYVEDNGMYNIWVYYRLIRDGTSLNITGYNNADYTDVRLTQEFTISEDTTYRNLFIVNTLDIDIFPSEYIDVWVKDLTLLTGIIAYFDTGNFYSVNLLVNASIPSTARSIYGVADIPPDTSIEILHSDDNSSWISTELDQQFFVNLESFNYSDLFIRYRLNTSNNQITPDVDFYYVTYDFNFTQGNVTILAGAFAEYNVSSIETRVGDYVHGNLTSPQLVDGKTYLVDEVTGQPGWDIRFNFTGIPENSTSLAFMAFADYEGNPAHDPHIEAYNFDAGEFVDMVEYGEGAFEWHNASLSLGGFIQADTGNVWLRFVHHISGSNGHFINVDYLRLRAFVPTGGTVNVDAWGINWWLMIIWLVLVAIGVFDKNKIILMFAGFFGIILAILMFTTNMMVAVALISINLYLLYEGTA